MTHQQSRLHATISKTLLYYDGPQIILLNGFSNMPIIAVAVNYDGMEYPFFACYTQQKHLDKYIHGKADLHFVFANAHMSEYYFFDLFEANNDVVNLIRATSDESRNNDFWPSKGFFSSNHILENENLHDTRRRFNINGAWEADDFTQFNRKMFDMYAIMSAKKILESVDSTPETLAELNALIINQSWEGGNSYVNFYKPFTTKIEIHSPIKVKSIQYASPGNIDLIGDKNIFDEMSRAITKFEQNIEKAAKAYQYINKILGQEKLKTSKASSEFSSEAIKNHVKGQADIILNSIGIDTPAIFMHSCNDNILIYSKLVLSIFRRIKGVYNFISEGRVQFN